MKHKFEKKFVQYQQKQEKYLLLLWQTVNPEVKLLQDENATTTPKNNKMKLTKNIEKLIKKREEIERRKKAAEDAREKAVFFSFFYESDHVQR